MSNPLELVANLLEEFGLQALDVAAALKEQPKDPRYSALLSWNGFKAYGDKKTIDEVQRLVEFEAASRLV